LAVQAVFIANLSTGGATNSEITYAAYGGIGLAMATTKNPAIAVTLAIFIGQTFGLIFYNGRMALYSFWNTRAEKAAHNNDDRQIVLNHLVYPQITTFLLRAVPVFLAIFYGKGLVNWLINSIPAIVTHIIQVLGGVLPALGIAMLMSIVIKNKAHFIFFFAGFVLLAFAKLSMIAIVFIAALVAYLYYVATAKNNQPAASSADNGPEAVDTDDTYEDEDLF
ncbi:MAG: PTS sugar transporter subunit IIC, partial [Bombilactobacillus sp.]|nr:PTS sugar transporter subunit IIC [Bombilactobacillus sp.]